MKIGHINIIFFLVISIFSETSFEIEEIKSLVSQKKFKQAELNLKTLLSTNPNNPDLIYIKAELLFEKGESKYYQGDFIEANKLYSEANVLWPNHEKISKRILELSIKKQDSSKKQFIPFAPLALQGGLDEKSTEIEIPMSRAEKISFGIFLQNIIVILLLVFIFLKMKS
jgi:tetratricopeptide (TPR) repeat protein